LERKTFAPSALIPLAVTTLPMIQAAPAMHAGHIFSSPLLT